MEFLLFTLLTSVIAHLLFSWMGYNPTDDGFTPAYLTYSLDNILPGGRLIKTNEKTYRFLNDLNQAKSMTKTRAPLYTILPDNAGNWAKSEQLNPLPIDWVQGVELNHRDFLNRVVQSLEIRRGKLIMIIQKVQAADLATGFTPLPEIRYYSVVLYIRKHFTKIGETEFFDLYQ
ncbi:MAG: hypothetical protein GY765_17590 [bacterium]|nr:hypothetical protein [bacterium]